MIPLPLLALAGLAAVLTCAVSAGRTRITHWQAPAVLSAAFFAYSLWPILTLGPVGFWNEHVHNLWGVQIWFDLLCAIGVGWALLAPRARGAGMTPWPWLALIAATGSIGLLAMLARVLYREGVVGAGAGAATA